MDNEKSTQSLDKQTTNNEYVEISVNKKKKSIFKKYNFSIWMIIPMAICIVCIILIIIIKPTKDFTVGNIQDLMYNSEHGNYKNVVTDVIEKVNPTIVGISDDENKLYNNEYTNVNVTGFIFDSKGYILAPYDSIKDFKKIYIKFSSRNRKPVQGKITGFNLAYNLAIIKVNVDNLPSINFGDYSKVRNGDLLVGMGAPSGEDITANTTIGIVSFKNKIATLGNMKINLFQTDARISKYNIGGPICNLSGDVVGINVGVVYENQNIIKDGFVLSVNDIKKIIRDILNNPNIYSEDQ